MQISLANIGKRFNRDWIFRNITTHFSLNRTYAILGANGSGKSTFIQLVSAGLTSSEGSIHYSLQGKTIEADDVFEHISFVAPYLELIEEFTLSEMIDFHFHFKPFREGIHKQEVISILKFEKYHDRLLKNFSSGMKQRTKLALAMCSDTPVLLLDEPATNLDSQGVAWYHSLIERFATNRITIVCSNQAHEYDFCGERLNIEEYKK